MIRAAQKVGRLLTGRPSVPLRACWDFPWPHAPAIGTYTTRDGRLPVAGWALAGAGLPRIEIRVDGQLVDDFTPSQYREDIEVVLGHTYPSAAGPSGWARAVSVRDLAPGAHEFTVSAHAQGETVSLGSRTIDVTPAGDVDGFLAELTPLLRAPARMTRGHQMYLSGAPDAWLTQPTSVWGFSGFAQDTMRQPGARVLAVGSGLGLTVPNVIQLDVADYPNIDVISDAPELPFVDGVFDAVMCENVIEHVPNPFSLVDEIHRVLKPGGRLGINGTNMHFTHGFPSHYFNPTEFGMRHLLDRRFAGEYSFIDVPRSLRMILDFCLSSLAPEIRQKVEGLTVGELLSASPDAEARALLDHVPERVRRAVSTNIYFAGEKR